jgi:hypothetical protein
MPGVPSLLQDLDTFQAMCPHEPFLPAPLKELYHEMKYCFNAFQTKSVLSALYDR